MHQFPLASNIKYEEMENTPPGLVENKLDLKNWASPPNVSDGISNRNGKLRNPEIKKGKTSRIPISLRQNGVNGVRNQTSRPSKSTFTNQQRPLPNQNTQKSTKRIKQSSAKTKNRTQERSIINCKNSSPDKEESHRHLDKVNDVVIVQGSVEYLSVKVTNSENHRRLSDAANDGLECECSRNNNSEKSKVNGLSPGIRGYSAETPQNVSEIQISTNKEKPNNSYIGSERNNFKNMNFNENTFCNTTETTNLSQTQSDIHEISCNINNNNVDFIEMLTLDAKEFLTTKCVCAANTKDFCKDCFKNSKEALNDIEISQNSSIYNQINDGDEDNVDISSQDVEIVDCCNKINENIRVSELDPLFFTKDVYKSQSGKLNELDEEDKSAPVKNVTQQNEDATKVIRCDKITESSSKTKTDFTKPLQVLQPDSLTLSENILKAISKIDSIIANKGVLEALINDDYTNQGNNLTGPYTNQNKSSLVELDKLLDSENCHDRKTSVGDSVQTLLTANSIENRTVNFLEPAKHGSYNEFCVACSRNPKCNDETNVSVNHRTNLSKTNGILTCKSRKCSSNTLGPLQSDNIDIECAKDVILDPNCLFTTLDSVQTTSNHYFQQTAKEFKECDDEDISTKVSSTEDNLDPKIVPQHLVNPAGSFDNSSETLPSSSHPRQSAYGESCASRESIETDERQQEQAPICSRESVVDVVASDAPGRRVTQGSNPAAVSILLTETVSNNCGSCLKSNGNAIAVDDSSVVPTEHPQQLTWGFKNGRLVFAESKSNLEEARLPHEQVVCAPAGNGFAHAVNNPAELKHCDQPSIEKDSSTAHVKNGLEPPVSRTTNCSTDGIAINLSILGKELLSSKQINRRLDDSNSRLKYLENKLKNAGITDAKDNNVNSSIIINNQSSQEEILCKCNQTAASDKEEPNNNNINSLECAVIDSSGTCAHTKTTLSSFAQTHLYNLEGCNQVEENPELKLIEYKEFQKEPIDNKSKSTNNRVLEDKENNIEGDGDFIPESSHDICQFDVSDFSGFSSFTVNQPLGVYDEFIEDSSSDASCECDEDEHFIVIRRVRGDGIAMVNDSSERNKHNPDKDHLKSLLKKPGRSKDKKSNRVIFNENKNEFFDADYIILIREDCELDDDDDDGVCTCQQHEMVRLTCCEPNCNCQFEGGIEPTPQSPKFAPPMEFVDAVTLSPPEGYKDMELMAAATRGQQRGAVCRECSASHEEEIEEEGEASPSDSEMDGQIRELEEKEKTDQSQQTTPTSPPSSDNSSNQNYILETLTTTRVSQQQLLREAEENRRPQPQIQGSPISGILKGGRLWKQQSLDANLTKGGDPNLVSSDSVTSDDESNNRRSVRFIESGDQKGKRDICDGAPESSPEEEISARNVQKDHRINESQMVPNQKQEMYSGTSPETPEMTLTFKLGNHVLISNNSLKPNSAVRQLFPCTKSLATAQGVPEEDNSQQYLVTAESLRAFEEAKRSKLPQIIQSGETDETIKRAIERNTLRRSLIRYEPRSKKQPYKSDNSLVERIKQLTCDVDNSVVNAEQHQQQSSLESGDPSEDVLDSRSSPPGEESRNSPDVNTLSVNKTQDKSFSPSSSSTASSNSSMSINQNYHQARKLSGAGEQALMMDLKRVENVPDIQNNFRREMKPLPDIGGPHNHDLPEPPRAIANPPDLSHCLISNKISSSSNTSESRRQFLSTLAPLTACVTMGVAHNEDYYYHLTNSVHQNQPGDRISVASSGTEYSLEDINDGLQTEDEEHKRIAPDVLAGTPSASESGDELAMFVQQDAGRIERIKKKYQPVEQQPKDNKNNDEDDEHDDYGFNRRPSVRGIKPRFSTTTEILQQIQNQLQPPVPPATRVAWPYYSESAPTDNSKQKNANQNSPASNYQYVNVPEDVKSRGYPPQYRPTSLQEESLYQNCANQRCVSRDTYQRSNANVYSSVIRMGNDYYQSLPLNRQINGRPQSPPPMDMSKQYHQTMVYIPYNHIEGYQPVQYYQHTGTSDYVTRVSSQNQINKRYIEPVYQSRVHHHVDEPHYNPNVIPPVPPKALNRVSYPNGQPPPHIMGGSRSESPLPGQFSTARSTQTPAPTMSTCGYYPSNPRYRPKVGPVWQGEGNYATKVNRHSFPSGGPRYPPPDSISLTDSDSQHSGSLPNGYRQSDMSLYASKDSIPSSPTKPRFIERGVPEGAASVSPQDISGGVSQSSSSTMTSPTSPQNPPVPTNQKAMFYAMNV